MNRLSGAARALALLLCAGSALAQYPSKPIRFVVGFPPGGSADPTTRILGAALAQQLGQPVVVENRPGADSAIAAEMMTRQPPDGYTIMFASNSAMTAAVALRKAPAYDPLTDFTPISILYNVQLMNSTGISMLHVPYKGEGPLMPDIIAGRLHSSFLSQGNAISLAKEGKLRALAVLLDKRSPLLPEVPTIAEAGAPAVTVRQWAGVFGPPKMPRDIVERLNKEVNAALKRPDVLEQLQRYGYAAEGSTPEGLAAINRDDLALWRRLVAEAGIALE